ncbi:hypothetical protein IAU59_007553 [Kwoniella sp. CBS 9459]
MIDDQLLDDWTFYPQFGLQLRPFSLCLQSGNIEDFQTRLRTRGFSAYHDENDFSTRGIKPIIDSCFMRLDTRMGDEPRATAKRIVLPTTCKILPLVWYESGYSLKEFVGPEVWDTFKPVVQVREKDLQKKKDKAKLEEDRLTNIVNSRMAEISEGVPAMESSALPSSDDQPLRALSSAPDTVLQSGTTMAGEARQAPNKGKNKRLMPDIADNSSLPVKKKSATASSRKEGPKWPDRCLISTDGKPSKSFLHLLIEYKYSSVTDTNYASNAMSALLHEGMYQTMWYVHCAAQCPRFSLPLGMAIINARFARVCVDRSNDNLVIDCPSSAIPEITTTSELDNAEKLWQDFGYDLASDQGMKVFIKTILTAMHHAANQGTASLTTSHCPEKGVMFRPDNEGVQMAGLFDSKKRYRSVYDTHKRRPSKATTDEAPLHHSAADQHEPRVPEGDSGQQVSDGDGNNSDSNEEEGEEQPEERRLGSSEDDKSGGGTDNEGDDGQHRDTSDNDDTDTDDRGMEGGIGDTQSADAPKYPKSSRKPSATDDTETALGFTTIRGSSSRENDGAAYADTDGYSDRDSVADFDSDCGKTDSATGEYSFAYYRSHLSKSGVKVILAPTEFFEEVLARNSKSMTNVIAYQHGSMSTTSHQEQRWGPTPPSASSGTFSSRSELRTPGSRSVSDASRHGGHSSQHPIIRKAQRSSLDVSAHDRVHELLKPEEVVEIRKRTTSAIESRTQPRDA